MKKSRIGCNGLGVCTVGSSLNGGKLPFSLTHHVKPVAVLFPVY